MNDHIREAQTGESKGRLKIMIIIIIIRLVLCFISKRIRQTYNIVRSFVVASDKVQKNIFFCCNFGIGRILFDIVIRWLISCRIHTFITFLSASPHLQPLQRVLMWLSPSITEEMFGPVGRHPLNVKLLCRSDVWQPASPRQQPGLSMPRVNTPQGQASKTHKAWSINYSEWQINVFYNSTLAFHCSFTSREEKQKRVLSINMHFIP